MLTKAREKVGYCKLPTLPTFVMRPRDRCLADHCCLRESQRDLAISRPLGVSELRGITSRRHHRTRSPPPI